jgi:uncharacterized protein YbjT (DUF2867 family)
MTSNYGKTALIVGATGLVGSHLVRQLTNSALYERVSVLTRRPLAWQHPRLQEITYNFDQPNSLLVQADHIFCCLGTTIKQAGSREAFRKVDYQYPMDIARMGRANGASLFAIVSSMGADVGSTFFYSRVKGEVERDLATLDYPALLIFRPSLLLGQRREFRLGERIGEGFMRLLTPLIPAKYRAVEASNVAKAMIKAAEAGQSGIFESDVLK